jgi:diacylglycerol O-acyltransferase / wax synthase
VTHHPSGTLYLVRLRPLRDDCVMRSTQSCWRPDDRTESSVGSGIVRPTRRLAAVDEANLTLDHRGQVNVFLIGGILGRGGFVGSDGDPDMTLLRIGLCERIKTLPQLRRVAMATGRRHGWASIEPDLDHHVRLTPAVDGIRGLGHLCADLMNEPLPMDRPLWELLVVPGASTGGVGMVLRIHHAIADGIAAVALVRELFEEDPRATPTPEPVDRGVGQAPDPSLRSSAERLREGLHRIMLTLSNHDVDPTVLLGVRSAAHGVEFLSVDLDALESQMRSIGATVNDVLLCAVAAGYRATFGAVGESVPEWLPVSVPVALARHGSSANQVGVMLVRLPLEDSDPADRLQLYCRADATGEAAGERTGHARAHEGPDRRPHPGSRRPTAAPCCGIRHKRSGPERALRLCGAPVTAIWPVAVLAANVRSGVAAVSYEGRLWCAVHFDAANIPGSVFAEAMTHEFSQLTT